MVLEAGISIDVHLLSIIFQRNNFSTDGAAQNLVSQQFAPLLAAAKSQPVGEDPLQPAVIANASAKVGSIGDNGL
jgi:hypothetical protein